MAVLQAQLVSPTSRHFPNRATQSSLRDAGINFAKSPSVSCWAPGAPIRINFVCFVAPLRFHAFRTSANSADESPVCAPLGAELVKNNTAVRFSPARAQASSNALLQSLVSEPAAFVRSHSGLEAIKHHLHGGQLSGRATASHDVRTKVKQRNGGPAIERRTCVSTYGSLVTLF